MQRGHMKGSDIVWYCKGYRRWVCHFLNLLTPFERGYRGKDFVDRQYHAALRRAKFFGGKRYHRKCFRGGVLFDLGEYADLDALDKAIRRRLTDDAMLWHHAGE